MEDLWHNDGLDAKPTNSEILVPGLEVLLFYSQTQQK